MEQIPCFWKTSLEDIKRTLDNIVLGKTGVIGYSAGKREIYSVEYGDKQDMGRKANYCSAVAAGSAEYYAQKGKGIKPVVLLAGAIHGGEMEGIAALLNLINVIENGTDLRGRKWDYLKENWKKFRLILLPCVNPDGRKRLPFDSMAGKTFEAMRYYMQGTWKDGTLCGWPDCKKVHPVLREVEYLGAYFNDAGVNIAEDNVFSPMAEETKALMALADREAPDFTVQLHGGANCVNMLMPLDYAPAYINGRVQEFDRRLDKRCREQGLKYYAFDKTRMEWMQKPVPFTITSAIYHLCGGISLVYETNMALDCPESDIFTYDEILDSHMLLFEEIFRFLEEGIGSHEIGRGLE